MVNSGEKSANKKKKRKLTSAEKPKPPKKHRSDEPQEEKQVLQVAESSKPNELDHTIEVEIPWTNLQLVLWLQSKEIDLQKKVELAFGYVNSRATGGAIESEEDYETVNVSRLVAFISDWVQSLLISTDKKIVVEKSVIEACLDRRCWLIFKYCLEESLKLQVSLSLSRNLLRAFCGVARNALSLITEMCLHSRDLVFIGEGFELYGVVLDCVSMVFLSHSGLSNENLDLWVSTVRVVLELVHKIYDENLVGAGAGAFALGFSCLVLEPFAKFLRVHPPRKNGFRDFVDQLLGPLLHSLGVLHVHSNGSDAGWTEKLLTIVEEVLSQGLFHSIHIDGFLSLHSTGKYSVSNDAEVKHSKTVIKSYHRHLFDKMEKIMASKEDSELNGLGELFHLLVNRVKNQKAASILSEQTKMAEKNERARQFSDHSSKMIHHNSSVTPDNSFNSSNLTKEKRESLLNFFVQIMEPLFLKLNGYLQTKLEGGPLLLDVHYTLKSINLLLASLFHEKLYIKTEDISEGAFLNFLKKVYSTIFSFSTNLLRLPVYDSDSQTQEMLILLAKQLFVAVRYFLDIEYEVIEKDLTSLWLMVLSYLALSYFCKDIPDQCSLTLQILGFGSQLVELYSELRQVGSTIFSLCKAIRLIIARENNSSKYGCFGFCTSYLPCETYAKSVGMLLCAQEFKLAIHNGIKSIPEGQASECIKQLSIDLSESMEWMKSCSAGGMELQESHTESCEMLCFDLQAERFGRGLSEMYGLVLDSLTVTVGNSRLVGQSVKDLMTVIHPCMSILVGEPNSVYEFLSYITGKNSDKRPDGNAPDLQNFGVSTHWVFVFFFRLYMSARSLYRQAIILMPPDASRKMSAVMSDSFTAYSGRDLMERTEWKNDSYFCWIIQPSASLLDTIQSVCDICLEGRDADCSPLIYVLHAMALQRLADLNRQIKSLEYILQSIDGLVQVKLSDGASLALYCKRNKKRRRCLSNLKKEAEGLTEFIMSYLSLLDHDQVSVHSTADGTCLATFGQALDKSDKWDLGISSMNKKSLPTAFWWIVCQNIDIWSLHAGKKKLKIFLSNVICTGLPALTRNFTDGENNQADEAGFPNEVTVQQISSELLTNSILYEHKFVRRHLASRFCSLLKKSVLPLFGDISSGDFDLTSSPNWPEILSSVGSLAVATPGSEPVTDKLSEGTPISHLSHKMPADISTELTAMKSTACQSLLRFLRWMPKGYMSSRTFSLYMTCLLNIERHVISNLLECQDASSSYKQYDLLRLLVSCRRGLKCLLMAFCDKTRTAQSSIIPLLSEDLWSVLWFFKSALVVVGLQETLTKDHAHEIRDMIFSLMDYTSYVCLAFCKYHFTCAFQSMVAQKPQEEQPDSNITEECCDSNEYIPSLENKAWTTIPLLAESLKVQMQVLFVSLKENLVSEKTGNGINLVHLNKLSSTVSCINGFLWGLSSGLDHSNATDSDKVKLLGWISKPHSRIGNCIDVLACFIGFILQMLFVNDYHRPRYPNVQRPSESSSLAGSEDFSDKGSPQTNTSGSAQNQKSREVKNFLTSLNIDDNFWSAGMHRNSLQLEEAGSVGSHCLNNCLVQSLLKGDNPEAAILIRQLLMASSALLRLNLEINYPFLVPCCFGLCNTLLLKLADVPQPFSFVWLDGVFKYLEELGSYIHTNDKLAENWHARLIEIYLNASGKCITLQGKETTLASHETESSTKKLSGSKQSSETSLSRMSLFLDLFKTRLRMSFKVLISKSSDVHMLSAIQAIERALVGVHKGCETIYKINTGHADGGKVSSTVAAGIDFLDLVLEYTLGGKHSNVVKSCIQSLVAALFNIILHLQSPLIFCGTPTGTIHKGPDPGAVVLMCVQVLTRVCGKNKQFKMNSWHVAQFLRIPGALFQDFSQLRVSKDQQFSIELFAACCRLLYTTLKQHKSESEKCVFLLQESSRVLLHCLELVDSDLTVRKSYFSWGVQEGVKCACYLRRIYEELRQQKDFFGKHCFKFLSDYIWVYSGHGPFRTGIRREIDEALKPGVYALVDACSADDLQYLHSVFGEGPCRNTLAILQHDYKLKFQYEGKV